MDKGISVFLRQFVGLCAGFIIYVPVKNNLRAIALGAVYLHQRSRGRHYNHRLAAIGLRRIGHSLRMIAGRCGNQSLAAFLLRKRAYLVISAAQLISSRKLHIFRFEVYLVSRLVAEIFTEYQLSLLCYFFYHLGSLFKLLQGEHFVFFHIYSHLRTLARTIQSGGIGFLPDMPCLFILLPSLHQTEH